MFKIIISITFPNYLFNRLYRFSFQFDCTSYLIYYFYCSKLVNVFHWKWNFADCPYNSSNNHWIYSKFHIPLNHSIKLRHSNKIKSKIIEIHKVSFECVRDWFVWVHFGPLERGAPKSLPKAFPLANWEVCEWVTFVKVEIHFFSLGEGEDEIVRGGG